MTLDESATAMPADEAKALLDVVNATTRHASAGRSVSVGSRSSTSSAAGLWWTAALFIAINHVVVVYTCTYALPITGVSTRLLALTVVCAWLNLLGVTAGYHRLWSHNAYKACLPLRIFLSIIGLTAFQGSIRWWVIRHRLHHRFTDTALDPYDSTRGLFYSHIGWLFLPPPSHIFRSKLPLVNVRDLDTDIVVALQKKYLLYGYIFFGGVAPALMGHYLCADGAWAGFLYIGMLARFLSWHCIFSINSFSHWKGAKEYQSSSSAVSVALLGLLQNGEGYHNYHHTFPHDYRHGVRWYDWDPTKWCIALWCRLGLAWDVKVADATAVQTCQWLVKMEEADGMKKRVMKWPISDDALPLMTPSELSLQCSLGRRLLVINAYVVEIPRSFFAEHPGGDVYLRAYMGKDASNAFNGGMNMHTAGARRLMELMRVARYVSETETNSGTSGADASK